MSFRVRTRTDVAICMHARLYLAYHELHAALHLYAINCSVATPYMNIIFKLQSREVFGL